MDESMEIDLLLASISPCGLDCGRCLQNPGSPISRLSAKLREELGNFGKYAPIFSRMDPVFENYPQFEGLLERLDQGACRGCREGGACLPTCAIPSCVRERGLHFCADCPEFPCGHSGLTGNLQERYEQRMRKMQVLGFEAFVAWLRGMPRYP